MSSPWNLVELEAAKAISRREWLTACDLLSQFIQTEPPEEELREALALRGTTKRDLGDLVSAKQDLELAHTLSKAGTYARYTIELMLALVFRGVGDLDSERATCVRALETSLEGTGFSAGAALESLLRLGPSNLSDAQNALVWRAIKASWATLGIREDLPGVVDECVERIVVAERAR